MYKQLLDLKISYLILFNLPKIKLPSPSHTILFCIDKTSTYLQGGLKKSLWLSI